MKLATRGASAPIDEERISVLYHDLCAELERKPDLLLVYHTVSATRAADSAINHYLSAEHVIGATSYRGVMTDSGVYGVDGEGLALLGICDEEGAYGTGFAALDGDPAAAAAYAFTEAIQQAGRPGELPGLILVHTTRGAEESVIGALDDFTRGRSPVLGGSAADDGTAGEWSCFGNGHRSDAGVALAVLYPSTPIGSALHSGYASTGVDGLITAAAGRTVHEIDGRPAAIVYSDWLEGALDPTFVEQRSSVFATTVHSPLGRAVDPTAGDGCRQYAVLHPERVTDDKGLTMLAEVTVGQQLHLLTADERRLIGGAGQAVNAARGVTATIAGGVVTYDAGCRLAVGDDLEQVRQRLSIAFDGAPFVTAFTHGEQGRLPGGGNQHGNLMVGAAALGGSRLN